MRDEVTEYYTEDAEAKSHDETNFNERKATCKMQDFYILLTFSLISIALLIALRIYCYLIKYQGMQNHLLSFYFTSNRLKT